MNIFLNMMVVCMQDTASMDKGRELFRNGLLSEAVLALEAEVQRNGNNVEAWRLLGTVQAENDDDQQACICKLTLSHYSVLHVQLQLCLQLADPPTQPVMG